jgi:hypothetical protein
MFGGNQHDANPARFERTPFVLSSNYGNACDTNMTTTTTSKEETSAAFALLRETSYFAHAPEALLQELAGP